MTDSMRLQEALTTTRAIRRFRSDPVPEEVIEAVLDSAIRAPTGGLRQNWRFLVVREPGLRRQLGEIYGRSFREVYTPERMSQADSDQQARVFRSADYLADHMGNEAPALILTCLENSPHAPLAGRSAGASIYPAVQNLLLAARGFGLGTCLTTLHLRHENEVKELLGIPAHVDTYALIPIGYPATSFGPVRRQPVETVTYRERWGQDWSPADALRASE